MTNHLIIRLGREGEYFCHSPPDDLDFLGTVQEGLAVGALARRSDRRYFQLNGDFERELDIVAVEAALALQQWRNSTAGATGPATSPVITVKRRRVLSLPKAWVFDQPQLTKLVIQSSPKSQDRRDVHSQPRQPVRFSQESANPMLYACPMPFTAQLKSLVELTRTSR